MVEGFGIGDIETYCPSDWINNTLVLVLVLVLVFVFVLVYI